MKTRITSSIQLSFSPAFNIAKASFLTIMLFLSLQSLQAGTISYLVKKDQKEVSPASNNELSIYISGNNLILSWEANKATLGHFEVEKSFDGQHFSTIGLVLDAPENTNTCMFKDKKTNSPSNKTIWYRVKSINKDGSMFYTGSSRYTIPKATSSDCTVSVSPNPFNGTAVFKFISNKPGLAEVKVQNLAGETLLSKQSNIMKGSNSIQVEGLSKLTSGIYMAQFLMNGVVIDNQRVVKD